MAYNTKPIGVAYADPELDGVGLGASGGTVGFYGTTPTTQPAALTAQLTEITIANAAGTPDYALQAVINTNAWGLASEQELISLLYVIQNLQVRLQEAETKLETLGLIAAN